MARNIPLVFMRYQWDAEKDEPVVEPNAEFVAKVQARHAPTDTLLLICRSGGRSAWAVNFLAKAGFTNAYNVIDGTEGDKVDDPGSAYHGKRMRNGWKNSGIAVDLRLRSRPALDRLAAEAKGATSTPGKGAQIRLRS